MTSLCRHWRLAALPHLYCTVVLRRVGQVFAFADTLRSTEYACLVRSITLICYVPNAVRTAYRRVVLDILDRCSNLAHLTFGPTCIAVCAVQDLTKAPFDNVLAASILHVLPKLATFRILDSAFTWDPETAFPAFLLSLSRVVKLELPLSVLCHDSTSASEYSNIHLQSLEEITISPYNFHVLELLASWQLPRLSRVYVSDEVCDPSRARARRAQSALKGFTDAHAKSITQLMFQPCLFYRAHSTHLVPYSAIAPLRDSLRYIALLSDRVQMDKIRDILPVDESPPRLHIDVWLPGHQPSHHNCDDVMAAWLHSKAPDGTTKLRSNVRVVDGSLCHTPGILQELPPRLLAGRDQLLHSPLLHDFLGLQVVETSYALLELGTLDCNPSFWNVQHSASDNSPASRPVFDALTGNAMQSTTELQGLHYATLTKEHSEEQALDAEDFSEGPGSTAGESRVEGEPETEARAESNHEKQDDDSDDNSTYIPDSDSDTDSESDDESSSAGSSEEDSDSEDEREFGEA